MFFTVKDRSRVKAEAYMPEVIKALEPKPMIQEILKEFDEEFERYSLKYNGVRAFLEKSLKRVEEEAYRKGWIDGTECGAVGCKGGAEYCQNHADLY